MKPESAVFKSHATYIVLFPEGLAVVHRTGSAEIGKELQSIATHALAHVAGPAGFLLGLAIHAEEWHKDVPKAPELEAVPFDEWFIGAEPSAMCHGNVPREMRRTEWWPSVEWFRPVVLFPRQALRSVRVKWTSTVLLRTHAASSPWRAEVDFWRTGALRRQLTRWGYPLVDGGDA